jgi:hypothetical protein
MLIKVETARGRRTYVQPEDLEMQVCSNGLLRTKTPFGPRVDALISFADAVVINVGGCLDDPEEEL